MVEVQAGLVMVEMVVLPPTVDLVVSSHYLVERGVQQSIPVVLAHP